MLALWCSEAPNVSRTSPKKARDASPTPWIASAIVILIVAAIAAWFFLLRQWPTAVEPEPAAPATVEPSAADASPSVESRAERGGEEMADPAEVLVETAAAPDSEPAEPVEVPVEPASVDPGASTPTVEPGQLALDLNFIGDCWTEITDGNGRRLFFDLGRAGRTVSVSGAAPLSILLGNADNVRLALNGIDYPISDADRRGQTARFTLSAP